MDLQAARQLALALVDSSEQPHHHYTSFRVAGKIFATAPPEGDYLHVFVDEETRVVWLALHPDWLEKLHWGQRVLGLRIQLAQAEPSVVAALLRQAHASKRPPARRGGIRR